MERRTPLRSKTPLARVTPLPRPTRAVKRRKRLNPVSAKKRREFTESRPVVAAVMERDGGCVLRNHQHLAGPCLGVLTPHHILKASQGGRYTMEGLVTLCCTHNGWAEDYPDRAWGLGLVVRRGETLAAAWSAMRHQQLAVGQQVVRCPDSGEPVPSLKVVHDGHIGCPAFGHLVLVVANPDAGPCGVLADHEISGRPL